MLEPRGEFGDALDEDDCYWIGFSVGNGHTVRNMAELTFGDRKQRYSKEAKATQFDFYVERHGHRPRKWTVGANKITARVEHKAWRLRWERLGYKWSWRSHTKRVPDAIWHASLHCRKQFLLGVLDSDGTVGEYGETTPALHMCQRPLLAELQQLFRTVGVESTLRGPYKADSAGHISWRLDLSGLQLFRHMNYGHGVRKAAVSVRSMPPPRSVTVPLQAIRVRKRDVTPSQYVLWKRGCSGGQMNVYTTLDLYHALGTEAPLCYATYEITRKRTLRTTERTYTLSVDDPSHRFDSEGVISQNSCADMQNEAIRGVVQLYPYDFARHRGLVINGHDQIVVECGADEVDRVKGIIESCMAKRIGPMLFPAVAKPGASWKDVS